MLECSICLDPVVLNTCSRRNNKVNKGNEVNPEAGTRLCCGHVFHKRCIKKWYREQLDGNTCPCCRGPIRFPRVSYLYNILILRFWYYRGFESDDPFEIYNNYIYYDNAGIILYINDIKRYAMHFGVPCLNQLRNKPTFN